MTTQIAIDMTAQGPVPNSPQDLLAALIAIALTLDPTLTTDLPGSLIEDISSTDTGALVVIDQAVDDLINSVSPRLANPFLLNQLGQIYGSPRGQLTNTSVFVVFTSAAIGFTIPRGFLVSDGTYQYQIQDGGIIGSGGTSAPLFAVATQTGAWAVPVGTVNQIATSLPASVSMTVTNLVAGVPQGQDQTTEQYRKQVLDAGIATAQGVTQFLSTQLANVPGVQSRLVSSRLVDGQWEVLCGGGDPYEVAYAIYIGIGSGIALLTGSVLSVLGITNANPGVVSTDLNHGFTSGQVINIAGVVGMSGVNNTPLTVTVLTEKTFSIGVDTTSSGSWTSGGVVTPNLRNVSVSIIDYPDTFVIPYVNPPQQTVTVGLTWNTTSPNFVSDAAVSQLATQPIVDYINGIVVGSPINIFELNNIFQTAVASIIATPLVSRMVWVIAINGIVTAPDSGTGLVEGDPESYFYTTTAGVTVTQG